MDDKYVWRPGDIEILGKSKLKSVSTLEQAKQLFGQELDVAVQTVLERWRKFVGKRA